MKVYNLSIENRDISLSSSTPTYLVSETVGDAINATFDSEWTGLDLTVIMKGSGSVTEADYTAGTNYVIPQELMTKPGVLFISFVGDGGDEEDPITLRTKQMEVPLVVNNAYPTEGSDPEEPSQSIFAQWKAVFNKWASPTATVDANTGTPSVTVDLTGDHAAFSFHNLKGETGPAGTYTAGSNIQIANNVISATDTKDWPSITGKPTTVSGYGITDVYTETEVDTLLATKQDTISDLSTIRSGAASGATAYQKPATGVPKSDLASDVQTSLGKADTALQEHQSLSAYRTSAAQDVIDAGKQATISDLATIRSGAALGATALQSVPSTYRTSADQDVIDSTKQDIISDLSTIRSGAALGATALQSVPSTYRTSADQDVIDATKQDVISDLSTIRSGAALGATALQSVPNTYRTSAAQDVIDAGKQDTITSSTDLEVNSLKFGQLLDSTGDHLLAEFDDTTEEWYLGNSEAPINATVASAFYVPQVDSSGAGDQAATKTYVDDSVSGKQDTLTAGTGITISSNTVSNNISPLVPNQATSSNQLADKDFVNSSINSVTAFYITKNATGDQFATKAELLAASTFYSGGVVRVPTRNDYCIVQADETHDSATTRYIYQNSQWEFQYVVNETAFTAAQLAAINSGITSGKVTEFEGKVSDVQVNGTSVTSSGVANVPLGSSSSFGVIGSYEPNAYGITNGLLWAYTLAASGFYSQRNFAFVGKGTLVNLITAGLIQGPVSNPTADDILTVNSSGNMQDSGKAFVTEMPASPTDNQILTAQGTQEYADPKGYLTLSGTQYQVAVSSTDAGTAGYITFVVDA